MSRPLSLPSSPDECSGCRENFPAGLEFYPGLDTANEFTVQGTSQSIAPVVCWQIGNAVIKVSPTFGLTGASYRAMPRFGVQSVIGGFRRKLEKLLR